MHLASARLRSTRTCLRKPDHPRPKSRSLVRRAPPSLADKIKRGLWQVLWLTAFRPTPVPLHAWRRLILRLFGARVAPLAAIYPSVRIWAPWNLQIGTAATIGPGVNLYNVAPIRIGEDAVISQGSHLCTATHDHLADDFALMVAPIEIGANAWIAASAVIGARSMVTRCVTDYTIVAGNPASPIASRPENARNNLGRRSRHPAQIHKPKG
jgi:putative colanic acid biosynthesis acetyltransferase WcaF